MGIKGTTLDRHEPKKLAGSMTGPRSSVIDGCEEAGRVTGGAEPPCTFSQRSLYIHGECTMNGVGVFEFLFYECKGTAGSFKGIRLAHLVSGKLTEEGGRDGL